MYIFNPATTQPRYITHTFNPTPFRLRHMSCRIVVILSVSKGAWAEDNHPKLVTETTVCNPTETVHTCTSEQPSYANP